MPLGGRPRMEANRQDTSAVIVARTGPIGENSSEGLFAVRQTQEIEWPNRRF